MEDMKEKLFEYINAEAEASGFQLVDVRYRSNRSVEIILDKTGGISIGECTKFNKAIRTWIESNDILKDGFDVDVCSPGLDRVLKNDNDYKWAIGKNLEVFVRVPVNGKTNFSGVLSDFENDESDIELKQENQESVFIQKENITKARLKVVL